MTSDRHELYMYAAAKDQDIIDMVIESEANFNGYIDFK